MVVFSPNLKCQNAKSIEVFHLFTKNKIILHLTFQKNRKEKLQRKSKYTSSKFKNSPKVTKNKKFIK